MKDESKNMNPVTPRDQATSDRPQKGKKKPYQAPSIMILESIETLTEGTTGTPSNTAGSS